MTSQDPGAQAPGQIKKRKRKRQAASSKLQAREDIIYEENERLLDRSCKRQASSKKVLDSYKIL